MTVLETGQCLNQVYSSIGGALGMAWLFCMAVGYCYVRYKYRKQAMLMFVLALVLGIGISFVVVTAPRIKYEIVTFEDGVDFAEKLEGYEILGYNQKKNTWKIVEK